MGHLRKGCPAHSNPAGLYVSSVCPSRAWEQVTCAQERELLTWASGLTFSHLTWELFRGVGRKGRSGSGISK